MNKTKIIVVITIFFLVNLLMVGLVFVPDISFGSIDPQKFKEIEIADTVRSIKWSKNGLYTTIWDTSNSGTLNSYTDSGELQYTYEFFPKFEYSRPLIVGVSNERVYIDTITSRSYRGDEFYKLIQKNELFTYITVIESPGELVDVIEIPFNQFEVLLQLSLNYNSTEARNEEWVVGSGNTVILGDYLLFFQYIFQTFRYETYSFTLKVYNFKTKSIQTLGNGILNYDDFYWSIRLIGDKSYLVGGPLNSRYGYTKIYEITKNLDLQLVNKIKTRTIAINFPSDKGLLLYESNSTLQGNYLTFIDFLKDTKYTFFIPYQFSLYDVKIFDNHFLFAGESRKNNGISPVLIDFRKRGRTLKFIELHNFLPKYFDNGYIYKIAQQGRKVAFAGSYKNSEEEIRHSIYMSKKAYTPALFSLRFSPLYQFNFYGLLITSIYVFAKRSKRINLPDILDYPKR